MEKYKLKESVINSVMAIVFSSILIYLTEGFGDLYSFILLIPFIVVFIHGGINHWLISITVVGGLAFILKDIYVFIFLMSYVVLTSLLVGISYRKGIRLRYIVRNSSYLTFSLIILGLFLTYYVLNVNPVEMLRDMMRTAVDSTVNTMKFPIDVSSDQIGDMAVELKKYIDVSISLLPSLIFIYSYVLVFINVFIALKIVNSNEKDERYNLKLNTLSLGKDFKVLVLTVIAIGIMNSVFSIQYLDIIFSNLLMIISVFLFFNGVLMMDFAYEKKVNIIIRLILLFIFIVVIRAYMAFVIVGGLDLIFNLRKRRLKNEI
ncbi:MAG: DUF2232 domain-containing protein [Tissierellia bacterium]|nr:DUF2232 domain-containing protein [Tissierellia bacterium]